MLHVAAVVAIIARAYRRPDILSLALPVAVVHVTHELVARFGVAIRSSWWRWVDQSALPAERRLSYRYAVTHKLVASGGWKAADSPCTCVERMPTQAQ